MNLIICMAGLNTRFHDAGFDLPKYLLPWNGKTIIYEILSQFNKLEEIVLVANKRDEFFKEQVIKAISEIDFFKKINFIHIPDTRGQAETVAVAISRLKDKKLPLLVHNADTIVGGRNLSEIKEGFKKFSFFVDTFISSSPNYSYVQLNEGKITKILEKKVISPFASSGFYGFKNSEYFMKFFNYNEYNLINSKNNEEIYISDVIREMISRGDNGFTLEIEPNSSTIVLGTPHEYGLQVTRQILMKND